MYSKTCVKRPLSNDQKLVSKTNYRLIQFRSIAEFFQGEHSAILLTLIKLPFVIKMFVLSIFEWRFYPGFTVMKRLGSNKSKVKNKERIVTVVERSLGIQGFLARGLLKAPCCVLEQDTWLNLGRQENVPSWLKNC